MRLTKCLKFIGLFTILALVYIHMQMHIFDLAYQGQKQEQQLRSLIEENSGIIHRILNLKSANNLGLNLLTEESRMQFVDPQNVKQILSLERFNEKNTRSSKAKRDNISNQLLSFLSFGKEAQAKSQR